MNVHNNLNQVAWAIPSFLPKTVGMRIGAFAALGFLSSIPFITIRASAGVGAAVGVAYWAGKRISLWQQKKNDFIRRIPANDWKAILTKIETLNHSVSNQELEAFQKGNWRHPIFRDENWSYFAFSAFLEGKIDQDTMCKLFLFDACQKHAERHASHLISYQLFDENGAQDLLAVDCLRRATADYLSDEEFGRLIEELRNCPPHCSQFFAIERKDKDTLFEAIIGNKKFKSLNLHLLSFKEERMDDPFPGRKRNVPWQIVASPEFVYQIHRSRFGENAICPAPALSYFQIEKLSDPTRRVACVPAFGLSPKELHGTQCEPLSVYHHDIALHHAIESANMHRPVWIAFAKFLKKKGMKWIVPKVLDRDLGNYLTHPRNDHRENFWIGLDVLYRSALKDPLTDAQRKEFNEKCAPYIVEFCREQAALLEEHELDHESLRGLLEKSKGAYFFDSLSMLYPFLIA